MREYRNITVKLIEYKESDGNQKCEDVAVDVAETILMKSGTKKEDIGVLLYVTQSPKFMTPSTSFYIHKQLNLGIDCFQYDMNQGSTGVMIGLQMIISLMQGFEVKKKGLLLFGDNHLKNNGCAAGMLIEHSTLQDKVYIRNGSFGMKFKTGFSQNGILNLKEDFIALGKQYLSEELEAVNKFVKQQGIQIDQVISMDEQYRSATEVIKKICEMKPKGKVIIGTFGVGISIAIGILHINENVYLR